MAIKKKTIFWPSMAGKCSVEILAWLKDRTATAPDPRIVPFLRDGTHLQTGVEKFLREFCQKEEYRFPYPFDPDRNEPAGKLRHKEFVFNGSVDGVFEEEGSILEVKCISEKQFKRVEKALSWKEIYPHYAITNQVYLGFSKLTQAYDFPDNLSWEGPFSKMYMIFKNRNTSEMIGGIPFEHPAYTFREDMVDPRDPGILEQVLAKHENILEHYNNKEDIPDCDLPSGYCYWCRRSKPQKRAYIKNEKHFYSAEEITRRIKPLRKQVKEIKKLFDASGAQVLEISDGESEINISRKDLVI